MLTAYKVSIVLLTGLLLLYAFQGYYPEFMSFFSEAFPPLLAGAAAISGFPLQKYYMEPENSSPSYGCFSP